MIGIYRDKARIKKNGEVSTPNSICKMMIDKIDLKILKDPSKNFLDPTCGNGQILCNILESRLSYRYI
jgi:type I restriction-modification system DNA methylase subunit